MNPNEATDSPKAILLPEFQKSCKAGEAGDICSILDEIHDKPDQNTIDQIVSYVSDSMPSNNDHAVHPSSIAHDEKIVWHFNE